MTRALRAAAALLVVVAVTAAALGWQPLGRFVIAWLPAGIAGGALLALAGMRRRIPRGALLFAGCAALLLALDAAADAITASEPLSAHLSAQPGRLSIWAAAALAGLGGLVAGRARS